ncbi:MAG: ABC transporter substrate-binding protein [Thermotogaceae bacterium]|nr:ABC transporter substrate-binding protein [Thermotogaceae bacterium]
MKKLLLTVFILCISILSFSANYVNAYTTLEEPLAKALFDEFQKETGIKVNWVRLSTGEVITRLEAEKNNPQASIWVGGVGVYHVEAKLKGYTTPYKAPYSQFIDAKFKDPEGYWIGLYVGPLAFATNKNRAKELGITPPTSWTDLLKPEYKGMIRMADPNTSGTAYNVITTMINIYKRDENKAFDYMKKLDVNVNMYTKSGAAPGKDCAIGETPIAIGYLHDLIKLQKEGAPIVITLPTDGSGYEIAAMSLIKGGKEPLEAKKLYNWILGDKAQSIIAGWYVIPLSPKAPKNKVVYKLQDINLIQQDLLWEAQNRERLVDKWNKEIGR